MDSSPEKIDHRRRRFFGAAALTAAIAPFGVAGLAGARPRMAKNILQHMSESAEAAEASASVVLVHGAWADGSSWAKVIAPLQSKGLKVLAAPMPLTSLSGDIKALEDALERTTGPVVLVAHAYAGAVIGACKNERVQALVFIAALTPDEGETVGEVFLREKSQAPQLTPDSDGLVWLADEQFPRTFCQNARRQEAALLAATQRPIAVACIQEKAPRPVWKDKPSWYLVAEEDRMINPATELFLARRMGARIRSEKVDHAPLVTAPELVVATILEAVTGTGANPKGLGTRQHG
jgi:pimeloyl-ACP methyl ester carboxylesterase